MRQGFLFSITLIGMVCGCVWAVGGDMGSGDGTEGTPYLIEDLDDFDAFSDPNNAATYWVVDVHTKLMTDINLTGRTYTTAVIAHMYGVFDGNHFTISNLTIDTKGEDNSFLGLFGMLESFTEAAELKNLGLVNAIIKGGDNSDYVGGLCGKLLWSNITNCHFIGSVRGGNNVGGLCGVNGASYLENCFANSIVNGISDSVGGLCGSNFRGNIINCYAISNVSGNNYVGGLCGDSSGRSPYTASIKNSYATGTVSGNSYVGGLCGNSGQEIYYASITNSYSTCTVSGNDYVGGLCGDDDITTISNSYFLYDAGPDNGYGIPLDDPNMMIQSNFTNWDFLGEPTNGSNDIWRMCADDVDYPRLSSEFAQNGNFACEDGVDIFDLQALAEHWLLTEITNPTEFNYACDANGDGVIDLVDFSVLGENW